MKMDRYQRHSLIDWFSQQDVKESSFAVIGCGAVGNEVSKNLALLGVGKIDLYDFDTIEIHNLTRSVLFREHDVGKNKAIVAAQRLKELDPNIYIETFPGDFWELMSFSKAKSYDCVLCCVDNFEARLKINQICTLTNTNLINTGIDSKFGQIEIFPFNSGKHIACLECNLPHSAYERIQKRYSCGWLKKISYIEKKIPTTIVTSGLTGSLAVANALNLINNKSEPFARRILIDSFTGKSTVCEIDQSSTCPNCTSLGDNVSILQASATIRESISHLTGETVNLTTSDPILVSYQCVKCAQHNVEPTLVFEKASKFDSTLITCPTCNEDSIEVTISDSFSTSDLTKQFYGKQIPVKFLRLDEDNQTIIIEME